MLKLEEPKVEGYKKEEEDISLLLNPEEYIKRRFSNPIKVKYGLDGRLKRAVEELSSEIAEYYVEDEEKSRSRGLN